MTTTPPESNDPQPTPAPDAAQTPPAPQPAAEQSQNVEQSPAAEQPQTVEQPQPAAEQPPAYAAAPAPGYAAPPAPPAAGGPGVPPYQPYQAPAPSSGTTNVLAIVAFVASFFVNIVGIVCGHIALSQIKRTGEKGRGFAIAGLIIGYVSVAISIVAVVILIIVSVASGIAVTNAVRNLPTDLPTDSSSDVALTVDCARLSAAADSLIPVLNDQIPNLATDPTTAQAQIVAAFDAFTTSTANLTDPDLASEVDSFNADVETLKADLNTYIATPEADRDSTQLESDVSAISDQFDTLGSYCG